MNSRAPSVYLSVCAHFGFRIDPLCCIIGGKRLEFQSNKANAGHILRAYPLVPIANLSSSQPLLNSKGLKRLQIRLEIHPKSHGGCGMFAIGVITFKQLNESRQQWESVYFPIINAEKWANASAAFPSHKPFTNEEVKHRRVFSFFSSQNKHTHKLSWPLVDMVLLDVHPQSHFLCFFKLKPNDDALLKCMCFISHIWFDFTL